MFWETIPLIIIFGVKHEKKIIIMRPLPLSLVGWCASCSNNNNNNSLFRVLLSKTNFGHCSSNELDI